MNPEKIYQEAYDASQAAAKVMNDSLPPESERGLDCGFAWVVVKPARGPFISWCKANKKGDKHWNGGWNFWTTDYPTQSIGVHLAAARAFAVVLQAHGIDATVGSRLD